jgi:two-component system NtrC family response regulator
MRAVIMADGSQIFPDDLGLQTNADDGTTRSLDLRLARENAELLTVIAALSRVNGNIVKAADSLGISRPTLYDLMNKLGLK